VMGEGDPRTFHPSPFTLHPSPFTAARIAASARTMGLQFSTQPAHHHCISATTQRRAGEEPANVLIGIDLRAIVLPDIVTP
jgi:hypothetical protein